MIAALKWSALAWLGVTPAWGSLWLALGLFAIATYLWLLGLVSLGFLVHAWHRYAPLYRLRPPRIALY